jgi:hypothetical protein
MQSLREHSARQRERKTNGKESGLSGERQGFMIILAVRFSRLPSKGFILRFKPLLPLGNKK